MKSGDESEISNLTAFISRPACSLASNRASMLSLRYVRLRTGSVTKTDQQSGMAPSTPATRLIVDLKKRSL